MDLSWPHPPAFSLNGSTPNDMYLGLPHKLILPTADNMNELICAADRGSYMYSTDKLVLTDNFH